MASVLACDVCGRVATPGALPPDVEQCRWSNAIEDYEVVLCRPCQATKTLAEILEHAAGAPGGTLDGAERGPYLVVPEEPAS